MYAQPEGHNDNIYPIVQAVPTGESVRIYCASFDTPRWSYLPHESLLNFTLNTRKRAVGNAYLTEVGNVFIRTSRQEHSGIYECSGTESNGENFVASSLLYVGRK